MTIQFNPSINGLHGTGGVEYENQTKHTDQPQGDFAQAIQKSLASVNHEQQEANASIVDLLSGKEQDVNTVVASMAKADMSFKMLVGVRNKLVEAYKETMRMQL